MQTLIELQAALEECQRENENLRKANIDSVAWVDAARDDVAELQRENEELTRKLSIEKNKSELLSEDIECIHLSLDDHGAPRSDKGGSIYSVQGRISKLIEEAKRQAVPEGWKLVPVEPTDEMIDFVDYEWNRDTKNRTWSDVYKAMISVAPAKETK